MHLRRRACNVLPVDIINLFGNIQGKLDIEANCNHMCQL